MRLLLDTHIFLWSLLEPARLTPGAAAELEDPENQLWLSPITLWECLVLADRGRVRLLPDAETWLREHVPRLGAHEAPINFEVALRSRSVKLPHRDPADRFLAATALVYDLTLVTADARLLASTELAVFPNR